MIMIYVIALVSIMLGSIAQYLLKIGVSSLEWDRNRGLFVLAKTVLTNINLLGGIACYGLSMIFWLYVLSKLELSKAYPLVSLGYVFTLLLGYFLLHESVNIFKVFGVVLIIVGVMLIIQTMGSRRET